MAIDWGSILGVAASAYGAYSSADAAKDARNGVKNTMAGLSTDLLPYNFYGPGGMFAGFTDSPYGQYGQPSTGYGPSGISGAGADILGRIPNMSSPKTPPMSTAAGLPSNYDSMSRGQQLDAFRQAFGNDPRHVAAQQGARFHRGGFDINTMSPEAQDALRRMKPDGGTWLGNALSSAAGPVLDIAKTVFPVLGTFDAVAQAGNAALGNMPPGMGGGSQGAPAGQPGTGGVPRNIAMNLGDLEPARAGLVGMGNGALARAMGMNGLPPGVAQALGMTQSYGGVPGMPNTQGLQGAVDQTLLRSMFDMNRGSAAPGLQSTAFAGASQQLADAGRGFGDVRDETLANLRAQAQPFEQRAYDTLQNDLFSTGRMGSSGGALQTEAFARGLGQADLSRQLSANQEARTTQQNALGLGQGLAGVGSGIAGLDDSLLQSAFGRFNATAGLSQGLQQERFGNSVLLNNMNYDRANQGFQNQITAANLPMAMQGQQLQLALQALGGQQALHSQGLSQFNAALAASQAAANARIGAGSNVAALAGQMANMPTSGDIWGQFLTGAGSRMMGTNSMSDILGGLFGGGKSTPPYAGDPRATGY